MSHLQTPTFLKPSVIDLSFLETGKDTMDTTRELQTSVFDAEKVMLSRDVIIRENLSSFYIRKEANDPSSAISEYWTIRGVGVDEEEFKTHALNKIDKWKRLGFNPVIGAKFKREVPNLTKLEESKRFEYALMVNLPHGMNRDRTLVTGRMASPHTFQNPTNPLRIF